MNIEFTSRHFNAPDNLKDYAISEVQKITKVYARAIQCQILLFRENDQFVTELNLSIPSRKLNVKESTDNVTKSIDIAVDKMITRVKKIKSKQNNYH
ncbi:MAG: ribosome-associated translation inhibitor RaiA [Planctomycetia bacterium]|nr:ribosome-associated translation inhibitor RaiA [Planctomycetia bacterium]